MGENNLLNRPNCIPELKMKDGKLIQVVSTSRAMDGRLLARSGKTNAEYTAQIEYDIVGNTLFEQSYVFNDNLYLIMQPDQHGRITEDGDNLVFYLTNTKEWMDKIWPDNKVTLDLLLQCCKEFSRTEKSERQKIAAKAVKAGASATDWQLAAQYLIGNNCNKILEDGLLASIDFSCSDMSPPTTTIGAISTIGYLLSKKIFASKTSVRSFGIPSGYNAHTHSSYFQTGIPEIDQMIRMYDSFDNREFRVAQSTGTLDKQLTYISQKAREKRDKLIEVSATSNTIENAHGTSNRPSPSNAPRNIRYYNDLIDAIEKKDYQRLYFTALDSCTQLPSRADIKNLVASEPLEFEGTKLRLKKIIYAGGSTYYFHEPGSKKIGLILNDGTRYYQASIRKKAFKD